MFVITRRQRRNKKQEKVFRIQVGPLAGHVMVAPYFKDEKVRNEVLRLYQCRQYTEVVIASMLGLTTDIVRTFIRKSEDRLTTHQRAALDDEGFPGFTNDDLVWCPGCGHKTKMPCLACWLATQPKRPEARQVLEYRDAPDSLEYDLTEDERLRLAQLREKNFAVDAVIIR